MCNFEVITSLYFLNTWNTKINVHYKKILFVHHTEKDQSVSVLWENYRVHCKNHMNHIHTLCGQPAEFQC